MTDPRPNAPFERTARDWERSWIVYEAECYRVALMRAIWRATKGYPDFVSLPLVTPMLRTDDVSVI